MDNKKELSQSTANMQKMTGRILRDVIADIAIGPPCSVSCVGGLWDQLDYLHRAEYRHYTPEIGDVFAHIVDNKISHIVSMVAIESLFSRFEEIDFTNGNKEEVYLSFNEKEDGSFYVIGHADIDKNGIYIRVPPELWAKAMKQRDIFLSSLNALNYSINIDEPFNSK